MRQRARLRPPSFGGVWPRAVTNQRRAASSSSIFLILTTAGPRAVGLRVSSSASPPERRLRSLCNPPRSSFVSAATMERDRQFPTAHELPEAEEERDPKRRKIRKGTRSCWECKRRKIRCTYTSAANAVCDGCIRRGTSCVSQEFPDEPAPSGAGRQMGDRLGRMEALVDQLVRKAGADSGLRPRESAGSANQSPRPGLLTPDASDAASPSGLFCDVRVLPPPLGPPRPSIRPPFRTVSPFDSASPVACGWGLTIA